MNDGNRKMKKIGIVTFFSNYNYGSVLQAYALMQYLNNQGYDAKIIDYLSNENAYNKQVKFRTLSSRIITSIKAPSTWKTVLRGKRASVNSEKVIPKETAEMYEVFRRDWLKPYGKSYHKDNDFDAFICGSDQIWQVSMPGLNYAFFLRFASENKRIAYAVSLGSVSIPKFNRKKFVKVVSGFKAISVRERKSKEMIEEICLNSVTHVLDPTLLVGRDFWDYKSNKTRINDRYILCYFLDEIYGKNNIEFLAKCAGIKVLWIDTGAPIPQFATGIKLAPFEFVSSIKNAEYVFTDSFHGCCFASLFEKNFYVIKRKYKGYPAQHIRISEMLELIGMKDREVNSCEEIKCLETIEKERYFEANKKLEQMREISQKFLEDALK